MIGIYLFREAKLNPYNEVRADLLTIYGLGFRKAVYLLSQVGVAYPFLLRRMNKYKFAILTTLLRDYIQSDVRIRRQSEFDISRLIQVSHIKGVRHTLLLPIHGQRTRTNAGTQRTKKLHRLSLLKGAHINPPPHINLKSRRGRRRWARERRKLQQVQQVQQNQPTPVLYNSLNLQDQETPSIILQALIS